MYHGKPIDRNKAHICRLWTVALGRPLKIEHAVRGCRVRWSRDALQHFKEPFEIGHVKAVTIRVILLGRLLPSPSEAGLAPGQSRSATEALCRFMLLDHLCASMALKTHSSRLAFSHVIAGSLLVADSLTLAAAAAAQFVRFEP